MTVGLGVCYCQVDIFSTCVANNRQEQGCCNFFQPASTAPDKCMNRNDSNDHCWSPKAQAFSVEHGVVDTPMGGEIPSEYTLPKTVVPGIAEEPTVFTPIPISGTPVSIARRTCLSCDNDPGCPLMASEAGAMGKSLASLADQDYWNIASSCISYIDTGSAQMFVP
jgi:hypothetical protein